MAEEGVFSPNFIAPRQEGGTHKGNQRHSKDTIGPAALLLPPSSSPRALAPAANTREAEMRQQLETFGRAKGQLCPSAQPGGPWEQQEHNQHQGGTILPLLTSCSVMLMRSSCCRNCSRMYLGAMSTRDWKEKARQRWLGQPWQCSGLRFQPSPSAHTDTGRLGTSTRIS